MMTVRNQAKSVLAMMALLQIFPAVVMAAEGKVDVRDAATVREISMVDDRIKDVVHHNNQVSARYEALEVAVDSGDDVAIARAEKALATARLEFLAAQESLNKEMKRLHALKK
ncbi:MAG: hypothetical protein KGI47_06450 [Betaproteobacteria bacterium]|nr:hypothetical protein [Betaproteobacteria bacterium]MDE2622583.1 hypothetical protein [Betaproteobacteria bacterium]